LFEDGLLVANGDASLNEPMRYRIERGRFENFDLAALMGEDRSSSLNGTFVLQGTGTDPRELTAGAGLEMEPSHFVTYRLNAGRSPAELTSGLLDLIVEAEMAESGSFDFVAVNRPFDEIPTIHITRGEFRNVNVGAFTEGSEQDSDLSGTATFT